MIQLVLVVIHLLHYILTKKIYIFVSIFFGYITSYFGKFINKVFFVHKQSDDVKFKASCLFCFSQNLFYLFNFLQLKNVFVRDKDKPAKLSSFSLQKKKKNWAARHISSVMKIIYAYTEQATMDQKMLYGICSIQFKCSEAI